MEGLSEYRQRLHDRMAAVVGELRAALMAVLDPRAPLEAGGWNPHQVISHLRDVNEQVYLPRLHRIVDEDNPQFENFDVYAWMAAHYDPKEPIEKMLAEFTHQCIDTAEWLRHLPLEVWSRPGTHPSYSTRTLQWWAERALGHIEEHLATMKK